jgi:serine/threonine-protein kinase HipA
MFSFDSRKTSAEDYQRRLPPPCPRAPLRFIWAPITLMWAVIPFHVGTVYAMWAPITVKPKILPTSRRNRCPHHSVFGAHIHWNHLPTSTGIRRTAPPLIELGHLLSASRAVEANKETAADLAYLRGRGTSLGGMRPKCTVIDDDGALSIGKFPSIADERAVTKGEVLALTLARKAGINAAAARIVESENSPVALIRRFDRQANGDRIMYVSAATMLGVEVTEPEEHTYTEIVDAIRVHGGSAQADIEELWRRIAFTILITNVDDHLRNHGFLHVNREFWRLSPAFDINPSPERVRELKTWISEDAGPDMTIDALMSVIPYFRIKKARAKEILSEVAQSVESWRTTGQSIGMTDEELEPFVDAFEHAERNAAKKLI